MIANIEMPLRGVYTVNGHDILIMAYTFHEGHVGTVFMDQDGTLGQAQLSDIQINWRYDDRRRRWVDVDTGEELGMGEDDDGDSED